MNDELTKLLNNLPEGILLYNQDNQKVVLANSEFKRLFGIDNIEDSNTIE